MARGGWLAYDRLWISFHRDIYGLIVCLCEGGRTSHPSYKGGRDELIGVVNAAGVEAVTEEAGRGCEMDVDVVVDVKKHEALSF